MADDDSEDLADFDEAYSPRDTDRKRGIFTKNDREYLLGEREISGQDERNLRYRMRQRVLQALLDIELLARLYPDEELEKIVQDDKFLSSVAITPCLQLAYAMSRHAYDDVHDELADRLKVAIFAERIEYEVTEERELAVKPSTVSVDINVEDIEFTIRELAENAIEKKADKQEYQRLSQTIYEDYQVDWIDKLLETEGWIELQPPGVDEEINVHPLLAEYIEAARED